MYTAIDPDSMPSTGIRPSEDMHQLAVDCLNYANGYFRTFRRSLSSYKRRFDNDLLYNMLIISLEKYFVALLARYDWPASHHMPVALFREAQDFEPGLTEEMKQTVQFIGKFESICSLDGFGYQTPTTDELRRMEAGMLPLKQLIEDRIGEL
jgi:hypothetical protein